MIYLALETDEADALSDALGTVENVNEHLTDAEARADAKLAAALDGLDSAPAAPEAPADRYPVITDADLDWDAYPALTEPTAAAMIAEIACEAGFLVQAILGSLDPAAVTVLDVLEAFRGNCWDDQHDGGAHRQDLIDVNRLFAWLDEHERLDDFAEVHALTSDEAAL